MNDSELPPYLGGLLKDLAQNHARRIMDLTNEVRIYCQYNEFLKEIEGVTYGESDLVLIGKEVKNIISRMHRWEEEGNAAL